MDKPLSIILRDTKNSLITICNQSGLPISILDMIIQDVAKDVHTVAMQQLTKEEATYLAAIDNQVEIETEE